MYTEEDLEKFRGPTFGALVEFAATKKHSLIREVELRTPAELSAIVVGVSVYEVLTEMPEKTTVLHQAMEIMKRRQSKMKNDKVLSWMNANLPSRVLTPVMNKRSMRNMDMRMFLARYPLTVLPASVFKPFMASVKKFLLVHLFKFRTDNLLYTQPPEFPSEDQLPQFITVIGTMRQLERNYPHLARTVHEMIVNITHFTITYCLDWICEVLILNCDRNGFVTYSYPTVKRSTEETGKRNKETAEYLESDPEISKKQKDAADVPEQQDENSRCLEMDVESPNSCVLSEGEPKITDEKRNNEEALETDGPSTSDLPTITDQRTSLMDADTQSTTSQAPEGSPCGGEPSTKASTVQHSWADMLDTALSDPNLPAHYKTMIRCLVASNRDLRNVLAIMKSQKP